MRSDLAARYARTQDDIGAIFRLYAETTFQTLAAIAPMNPVKVVAGMITAMERGAAIMFDHNGETVGSVGLMEQTWWHADDRVLVDEWCSVAPAFQTRKHLLFMVRELRAFSEVADFRS